MKTPLKGLRSSKRPMTEPERRFLQSVLRSEKGRLARWLRGGENAVVVWAILMLLFVLAWIAIAWAVRVLFRVEIGWDSAGALWIASAAGLGIAIYAGVSSVRWVRRWPSKRQAIRADLETGQVIEDSYELCAAKRFQEPEHGGLIYCLRTLDDKVLVTFDEESQDLGVQGENPLNSPFQPRKHLLIVRAPMTDLVISKQFSGPALDAGDPLALSLAPESWPEPEAFCKIRWDDLENHFCHKRKRR